MCAYASVNVGNRAANARRYVTTRGQRQEISEKWFIFRDATKVSVTICIYFPRFANIWISSGTFLFNERGTRTSIREYSDAYDAPPSPSEGISETQILSQFSAEEWSSFAQWINRLTDFFSSETFAAAAAAIALWQLPSDIHRVFRHLVPFTKDTSIHRPNRSRYNVLWYIFLYIFVHLPPKTARYIYVQWKTGENRNGNKTRSENKKFNEKKRALATRKHTFSARTSQISNILPWKPWDSRSNSEVWFHGTQHFPWISTNSRILTLRSEKGSISMKWV